MMMGTKFDIEKFDGKNDFGLWQVRMKALLEQQGLAATLEELRKSQSEHIDEFHKLGTSKDEKVKGDGGEGLYVRGRSGQRDIEHGTYSAWSKSQGRSSRLVCYICQSEEHLKRGYPSVDVMMAMSVEELLDWIMDSGGSYHITYRRDYLVDFEDYNGGNILLGDGRECRVRWTGKVQVQMRDGSSFMLDNVRYVSELRRNLISMGTLEKEGFIVKMQSGKINVIKGSLMVLSGTRRSNCVYTLDGQAVTNKTLKGLCNNYGLSKFFWAEDTTMSTYLVNRSPSSATGFKTPVDMFGFFWLDDVTSKVVLYRNMGFNESGEYKKTFIGSSVVTGSMQVLHGVDYREDSNKAAFAVAAVDKIYAHESLTFNNTVVCKVISMWKAGLKDDMDARSDVYVLSNGCRKCSDDSGGYYWEYTPGMFIHLFLYKDDMVFSCGCKAKIWATKGLLDKAKGNVLGMEIVRDQSCNTLRVSQSKFYNGKLVQTLFERHSILSLEGSLSRNCDVEKNGKWSCIYAVGSQEYQVVCTRLDIASADVGMLDKFDHRLQTDVQEAEKLDAAHDGFVAN
ncbi:hypothetical protein Tco_0744196 [Tanacetum coccineum]